MAIPHVGYDPTMGGFIPGLGINTANISMPKSNIAASDTVLNGGVKSAMSAAPGGTTGLLSAGTGLLGGIAAGVATYYSRKEGREMDRQINRYLGQSAGIARRAGLNAQYTGNQMASGQLNYMLNKAKRNPQAYEALSQLYASTVAQGTQARMQGMQLASQYMAQRKALTNSKYDWIAAITSGVTTGLGTGASTYAMFTQPKKE